MRGLTHSYSQLTMVSLLWYSSVGVRLAVVTPSAINSGKWNYTTLQWELVPMGIAVIAILTRVVYDSLSKT